MHGVTNSPWKYHTGYSIHSNPTPPWFTYLIPFPSLWTLENFYIFTISIVLPFSECLIIGIIQPSFMKQYAFEFLPCHLQLDSSPKKSVKFPLYGLISLLLNSLIEGHLSCSHYLVIMNKAAINIHLKVLQGCKWLTRSAGWIARSSTAVTYGKKLSESSHVSVSFCIPINDKWDEYYFLIEKIWK